MNSKSITNSCSVVAEHQRRAQNQQRDDGVTRRRGRGDHWLSNRRDNRRGRGLRNSLRHSRGCNGTACTGAEERRGRGRVGTGRAQLGESRAAVVTGARANVRSHRVTVAREFCVEHRVLGDDET